MTHDVEFSVAVLMAVIDDYAQRLGSGQLMLCDVAGEAANTGRREYRGGALGSVSHIVFSAVTRPAASEFPRGSAGTARSQTQLFQDRH
jgi:hypothetical protein